MEFNIYTDVHKFYEDTRGVLVPYEAQNMIILGNIMIGVTGADKSGWRDPANWFMAVVKDGENIKLTAVMTPPHNLTLFATDNAADDKTLERLIEGLLDNGVSIPGVMTEKSLAERFVSMYGGKKGVKHEIKMSQRIYELTRVNDVPDVGALRPAEDRDMAFLPYWAEGFYSECSGTPYIIGKDADAYRTHIASGRTYILEDSGAPVSMAKITREMHTVCGVAFVYTPPYFRGRGYATSCVAGVSRIILERGYQKCSLYTDLKNPVSNSIYRKIGYEPICDSLETKFTFDK